MEDGHEEDGRVRPEARRRRWWSRLVRLANEILVLLKLAPFLVPPLLIVAEISGSLVLAIAVFISSTGFLHWHRTNRRRGGGERARRMDKRARLRLRASLRFAHILIGAGIILAVLALVSSPLISAAAGALVTVVIWAAGHEMQLDGIGARFTCTLLMVAIAAFAYSSVVVARVVSEFSGDGSTHEPPPTPPSPQPRPDTGSTAWMDVDWEEIVTLSSQSTYEENCPELPDPRTIGHNLGELFWDAGEIAAGCGEEAEPVGADRSVWISQGVCAGALRSLAVAGQGDPVLLFGEPARFALEAARSGELLYAEVEEVGTGDVDIVATEAGNFVFIRSTQVAEAGTGDPQNCTEVTETAQAFVRLSPPIAELWRRQMSQTGWAWPTEDNAAVSSSLAFIDDRDVIVARGGCESDDLCHMEAREEQSILGGPTFVTLADLQPYMGDSAD